MLPDPKFGTKSHPLITSANHALPTIFHKYAHYLYISHIPSREYICCFWSLDFGTKRKSVTNVLYNILEFIVNIYVYALHRTSVMVFTMIMGEKVPEKVEGGGEI